jgi:hypothetical protein
LRFRNGDVVAEETADNVKGIAEAGAGILKRQRFVPASIPRRPVEVMPASATLF